MAVLSNYQTQKVQYVLTDHLGTPRAVVNPPTDTIIWRWDLTQTAFGDHVNQTDPDGDGTNYTLPLRYPGQYYDSEKLSHYNYFRHYDPDTGRYLQSDPIGLIGGISTYSYVGNRPIGQIDPQGLQYQDPWNQLRNAIQVGAATFEPTEYLASKGVVSASANYGGMLQIGPYYASIESGFVVDLMGRRCYVATYCGGFGKPALIAGVAFNVGVSGAKVCPGTSDSMGMYRAGGRGVFNNFHALKSNDGSWTMSREGWGIAARVPGATSSTGGLRCRQETICSLW